VRHGPILDGSVFDCVSGRGTTTPFIPFPRLGRLRVAGRVGAGYPEGCASGLYGIRSRPKADWTWSPSWPARHASRAPVALILPTFTYLSYGNAPKAMPARTTGTLLSRRVPIDGHQGFVGRIMTGQDGSPVMLSRARLCCRCALEPAVGIVPDHMAASWLTRISAGSTCSLTKTCTRRTEALAGHSGCRNGNHPEN